LILSKSHAPYKITCSELSAAANALVVQVAGMNVQVNMYLPVFLQLGKLAASKDWSASAGIFMGNKAMHGIAYRDSAKTACTMSGCKTLPSNCLNSSTTFGGWPVSQRALAQ
jgi:hypothetical protein